MTQPIRCPENICIQALPPTHLERLVHEYRYVFAREHAVGATYDLGCGYGYGASLIDQSSRATLIAGLDIDAAALWHARVCYPHLQFYSCDLNDRLPIHGAETIVAIEVLEHLIDPSRVGFAAWNMTSTKRVIVSFPIVPTVGKNPYHKHDLTPEQVAAWLPDFTLRKSETLRNTYWLGYFSRA